MHPPTQMLSKISTSNRLDPMQFRVFGCQSFRRSSIKRSQFNQLRSTSQRRQLGVQPQCIKLHQLRQDFKVSRTNSIIRLWRGNQFIRRSFQRRRKSSEMTKRYDTRCFISFPSRFFFFKASKIVFPRVHENVRSLTKSRTNRLDRRSTVSPQTLTIA